MATDRFVVFPMARRKTGHFGMVRFCLIPLLFWGLFAWADETPVARSSHPLGFAIGAVLPSMKASETPVVSSGGESQGASPTVSQAQNGGQASVPGNTNITGATRLEARAQSGVATAAGQQNSAGNKVGSIGGN